MSAAGHLSDHAIDADAIVARLRETDARSGGRRVAWTDPWVGERAELDAVAADVGGGLVIEQDAFANTWYVLPGDSDEIVLVGSHSDCVPDGGWLDGILGVHAALGVLEAVARSERASRRTLAVVDWADEEGTRFGRSLLGSSAATGALTAQELDALRSEDGTPACDVVGAYGFRTEALGAPTGRLGSVKAAVELHIEQGPTLERANRPVAAVAGCLGVRRSRITFEGEAGHAGAIAMTERRDPVRAAADFITELFALAERVGGFATCGQLEPEPAIVTAVPARSRISLDLRHADAATLAGLSEAAERLLASGRCAAGTVDLLRQDPIRFDRALIAAAIDASDGGPPLISGPLHDSASLAIAGIPAVMLFTSSIEGVSHSRAEDTPEEDLKAGIHALYRLVTNLLETRHNR